jgi:hypothetical protein
MARIPNPARQARLAADAVQELNRITLDQPLSAPRVSEITQTLCQLIDRLPQALEQLASHLDRQAAEQRIRMDDGSDPRESADEVVQALTDARHHLIRLSGAVHRAASPLFHMVAR